MKIQYWNHRGSVITKYCVVCQGESGEKHHCLHNCEVEERKPTVEAIREFVAGMPDLLFPVAAILDFIDTGSKKPTSAAAVQYYMNRPDIVKLKEMHESRIDLLYSEIQELFDWIDDLEIRIHSPHGYAIQNRELEKKLDDLRALLDSGQL